MKFMPVVVWMLLWPFLYSFTSYLSAIAFSKYEYGEPYTKTSEGVAIIFFVIWFGVGAALYYGAAKL